MTSFHPRCGDRVVSLHNGTTAIRALWEFNHGIVLSNVPLTDNVLFQVRIDRAIPSWSGSIEIGVISSEDPYTLDLPGSCTELTCGAWIVSGTTVIHNCTQLNRTPYGPDVDRLGEGDVVGVMRTDKGELVVFLNGVSYGVAADGIPEGVYAIMNLYGRCAQITIVPNQPSEPELAVSEASCLGNSVELTSPVPLPCDRPEKLRFHTRHGLLVKLSGGGRTAERQRPLDEFNNGVVMTQRPLHPDELFEIRIDRLVDKWSGSIEVGVTTHDPLHLEFPGTMTNMRSGTTIMSGCGILTNGKGTRREYGDFNLDELREGDRIGMLCQSNGELHFFINGLDQGIAAEKVPEVVWGVIDLYGMTVKVTIVDRDTREEQNLVTRRHARLRDHAGVATIETAPQLPEPSDTDRLTFHPTCGTHAAVINHGRTVHRPNAVDDFNNGVVLTARPLRPGELFEVRLDRLVRKWAGSVEIGVTTHSPLCLQYPSTMTNVRSGTWMMTGNGVMHNGQTVIDEYGTNLDRLEEGDRVGVCWRQDGSLHFFVNGVDQGAAAASLPGGLYGVLDLYGQAAQATLVDARDYSPDSDNSCLSNLTLSSELRFYHIHGRNARVSNNGLTASRPRTRGEFNHAVVMTNRPLRTGEMLQVQIDVLVDRWSGSIEAGVTSTRPEDMEFPSTMTDMVNTWILSGANVIKDGVTLKSGYACDLDTLTQGSRLGLMRHLDGTLHFYVDGADQGAACDGVPPVVYGVIDLYGQCAQATIIPAHAPAQIPSISEPPLPSSAHIAHRLSRCCGRNVVLEDCRTVAVRAQNFSHGVVFSALPLDNDQMFEFVIEELSPEWAGSLMMGATTLPISDDLMQANVPATIPAIVVDTWYLSGCDIMKNNAVATPQYCPSLDWVSVGLRLGIKRCSDGTLRFFANGVDLGVAATNIARRVFAAIDLTGSVRKIAVVSKQRSPVPSQSLSTSLKMQDSLEIVGEGLPTPTLGRLDSVAEFCGEIPGPGTEILAEELPFSECHGRNVEMLDGRMSARRVASYNQGLVVSQRTLPRGRLFQVRVEQVDENWECGFAIGVTSIRLQSISGPVNALGLKHSTWLATGEHIVKNGRRIKSGYPLGGVTLVEGTTIGVVVDNSNQLHVYVDGRDLGVACGNVTGHVHALVDLNGRVCQVAVVPVKAAGLEKADLEVQEKAPQRLGKIEAKLSSSDSYNSGIQQISSHAASSSLQSDTDNFNTQIQQLTLDLQRSQHGASESATVAAPVAAPSSAPSPPASSPKPRPPPPPRHCQYLASCAKFCKALGLPDGFFCHDEPICFCGDCYRDEAYTTKGAPPRESSVPLGWTRFPLRPHPNADAKPDDSWHVAFIGTSPGSVRRILDSGELLGYSQSPLLSGSSNKERDNHVVFSPCLAYASSENFTTNHRWCEQGRSVEATLALQLLVMPDSYKVGPPSGATVAVLDTRFSREAIEWVPKERGANSVSHLLVRIRS